MMIMIVKSTSICIELEDTFILLMDLGSNGKNTPGKTSSEKIITENDFRRKNQPPVNNIHGKNEHKV